MLKIGILTFHGSYNYGAFLQACSLCTRLNMEEFISAEIIDFTMPIALRGYYLKNWSFPVRVKHFSTVFFQKQLIKAFQRGRKKIAGLLSKDVLYSNNIKEFQKYVYGKYDVIIAGSDEIWKLDGERGFPSPYWLVGDLGCGKFSYAASSRSDWESLPAYKIDRIQKLLSEFELISVRDKITYNMVAKCMSNSSNVRLDCDPSFLYRFPIEQSDELLKKKARISNHKKNIVIMCDNKDFISQFRRTINKREFNLIAVYKRHKGCISVADLDPFEWLDIISHADLVIASFFHAICYSIVYNTPFIALGTDRKKSKLEELLLNTEFEERYFNVTGLEMVDWNKVINDSMHKVDFSAFVDRQNCRFNDYLNELELYHKRKEHEN